MLILSQQLENVMHPVIRFLRIWSEKMRKTVEDLYGGVTLTTTPSIKMRLKLKVYMPGAALATNKFKYTFKASLKRDNPKHDPSFTFKLRLH